MNFCFYICIVNFFVFLPFLAMDIVERLITFRDFTNLTNSQFADRAGIPRPTLSQFLNGRNKRLSDDLTTKLHEAYPNLNIMWLLFGEGSMTTDAETPAISNQIGQNSTQSQPQEVVKEHDTENQFTQNSTNPARQSTQNPQNELIFDRNDTPGVLSSAISQHIPPTNTQAPHPVIPTDPAKRIQSIMVFYSDNSYEIFSPAPSDKSKS